MVARDDVAQALAAHGLSGAGRRAARSGSPTPTSQRLAANLDQVQAAGSVPNYIWVLLGIFLAVSIIVMIV